MGLPPPDQWVTWPLTIRPVGMKKLVPKARSISLHDARRLERRKGQQQQEGGDELRPDEEGQPHPRHPRRAELNDRGDEVHRTQERGGDIEDHPDHPKGLPVEEGMVHRAKVGDAGERRIRGPAGLGRATRHEKARPP